MRRRRRAEQARPSSRIGISRPPWPDPQWLDGGAGCPVPPRCCGLPNRRASCTIGTDDNANVEMVAAGPVHGRAGVETSRQTSSALSIKNKFIGRTTMPRIITIATAAVLALTGAASAQNYPWKPEKPITLIVPWAAGGSTDQGSRGPAAQIERGRGQKIVG